ncbi:MAG TPA: ceramidase domain-containing protein [Pseudolabrys sp.]|nr:ceramidase domain-containing protein [Pseudolabrys sp.]
MWSAPIDLYCERTGPAFWAEPVNAWSNIAFLLAAAVAFVEWRQKGAGDRAVLALVAAAAIVGLGSFAFHTLATRGAMMLDVVPIGIFIYGYTLFALRRILVLSWPLAVMLLAGFAALSTGLASWVPRSVLNGSSGYFPALAALLVIGWLTRAGDAGRAMLTAAAVFIASLVFRIIDLDICALLPVGTHFLWHILNAVVIYLVLHGAIGQRGGTVAPAARQERK